MPYRLAHPKTKWQKFWRRWSWTLLFIVFFHYPINPSLDSLSGPVGDLEKAQELLKAKKFNEGIAYLIPEARSGNPEAQHTLSKLYGYHGPPLLYSQFSIDHCEETYWLDKAARQGHSAAQNDLAYAYKVGNGVMRDIEKAYLWQLSAQRNGAPISQEDIITFVDGELSSEAMQEIETTFSSWDHSQELAASILYIPYTQPISSVLGLLGINTCGVEVLWAAPVVQGLFF